MVTNKSRKSICFLVVLFVCSCFFSGSISAETQITILETSDLHGHIYPWNFFGGKKIDIGLAICSTLIKEERKKDSGLLLFDGGDTIQGTPLMYYYNKHRSNEINPMAAAMNRMQFTTMTVGNHEFNYGQTVLNKFIKEATFPVLSANIRTKDGGFPFTPYLIREVKGIKVGILGLTTPGIPIWEKPEHIRGLRFDDPVQTARDLIPRIKAEGATVILALVHSGMHVHPDDTEAAGAWQTDRKTWVDKGYGEGVMENFLIPLAEAVPEIDVIFAGHTHMAVPGTLINGVLIVQPWQWGAGIAKVLLTVDEKGKVTDKKGDFISSRGIQADPEILDLARDYQETALTYVNSKIGVASGAFPGGMKARWKDGPLADLINTVQLHTAQQAGYPAHISAASIFNNFAHLEEGIITVADVYGLYQYDNTLYVIEVTGKILKSALERNARYWGHVDPENPPKGGIDKLLSEKVKKYNWDMFSGINYKIDLSRPEGQRVVQLTYQGEPVKPDQTFRLAINNYRAGGGGGYTMYNGCPVIWQSMSEIRDSLVNYIENQKILDPNELFKKNWTLLPESIYSSIKPD